jgi:hypothetical protein
MRLGSSRYGLQCLSSCLLTAFGLQCAAIGCDGVDQTSEPPLDDGHVEPPSCSRIERYGPDEAARVYTCSSPSSAVGGQFGESTPPGDYECYCADIPDRVLANDAANCESAMEQACDVDADGPLPCSFNDASSPPGSSSICWPVMSAPELWRCECAASDVLIESKASTCEAAAMLACAPHTCSNSSGTCDLTSDGAEYECSCSAGGTATWSGVPANWRRPTFADDGGDEGPGLGSPIGADACVDAVLLTCRPSCESPRGACKMRPDGFSCTCNDGNESIEVGTISTNCHAAIASACAD